ncbi:MAG: hypothetical protein ACK47B_17105 [Armatimonadota bacterium]
MSSVAPRKPLVLVADVDEGFRTLENVFGETAELITVSTVSDALESLLGHQVDLVVCGIHFDDSRMFDLLRTIQADQRLRGTPCLCFRDLNSQLAAALLESLEISCRALGAEGFVDLYELKRKYGVAGADERFRLILERCLEPA